MLTPHYIVKLAGLLYSQASSPTIQSSLLLLCLLGVLLLTPPSPAAAEGDAASEGGGAGKGKGKAKQTMGRGKGGKDAQVCKQTKGSSKGIGTKAAAFGAASAAKAPTETSGASARKNPRERGRQSLGKCVNFFCELLDHTPRSTQAAPCGNVRGCACLLCTCCVCLV